MTSRHNRIEATTVYRYRVRAEPALAGNEASSPTLSTQRGVRRAEQAGTTALD